MDARYGDGSSPSEELRHTREEVRLELTDRAKNLPWWRKASTHLGHRGAFLITVGILYLALGWGYAGENLPPYVLKQLAMPIEVMGYVGVHDPQTALNIWGIVWMCSAVVAMVTAWWPPGWDFIGFIALWVFAFLWAALNFLGAVILEAPRAEVIGFIFFIHAVSVLIVSGMVDASELSKMVADDDRISGN
jgi:hypothetical protein